MLRPKGVAVAPNGEIYVADSWQNSVQVFAATGEHLAVLTDERGTPLDLGSPNGIALGSGNRIYIAERLSARLQIRQIIDEAR
jgi:DNA-binding beta-propeller fold protein YncE